MSKKDDKVVSLDQKRMEAFWGKPISVYTRAQAMEDGTLCDLTPIAPRYGFKIPMACTSAVWHTIEWRDDIEARKPDSTGQSTEGRLHDVLSMAGMAAQAAARKEPTHIVEVKVLMVPTLGSVVTPLEETFILVVSGGDNGEPVLTLMLPGED